MLQVQDGQQVFAAGVPDADRVVDRGAASRNTRGHTVYQTGKLMTLTPHGAATAAATTGQTATLRIQGRFESGAAQVTWTNQKSVLALWDFNIELD